MDKERLRHFCMLPRWRVRVEEVFGEGGHGGRVYWEWCDAAGKSSEGQHVEDGRWLLFRDVFLGHGQASHSRLPGFENEKAWQTLREWAESSGYRKEVISTHP